MVLIIYDKEGNLIATIDDDFEEGNYDFGYIINLTEDDNDYTLRIAYLNKDEYDIVIQGVTGEYLDYTIEEYDGNGNVVGEVVFENIEVDETTEIKTNNISRNQSSGILC